MEFTNEEMVKSLTSLIDETLEEIEEIKKSKFAASEISLGDSKSGVADKDKNGKLEAKKAEDEDEEEEDDDMDKAESCMDKAEDKKKKEEDEDEEEHEEEEKEHMKKSLQESEALIKSYVDKRFSELEKTISRLVDVVESIADAPAPRKGVPAGFTALQKSQEEQEPLSKSQVANQLFELKKSGKQVDSADIFKVETGNNLTVLEIANKYGLR